EVDLVHQQTQNQRYGSSHIGATAKDISNVVTDAASGVVDIFHGIDKAHLVGLGGKSAADKGKDTRDYLAAAFPELNAWERAGADASSAGMVDAGFENQKELTKMQLDNQKEIAEMQNETQKEIAGIQSATSRQNTKDQVYAQNEMLA